MNGWKRTIGCGELTSANIGAEVIVNGWVHKQRSFGDLVFLDVRDRTGIVQAVVNKASTPELIDAAGAVRSEYVLTLRGTVRARAEGNVNRNLPTGEVEIEAASFDVLNPARVLPFQVADEAGMAQVDETLRVRHRYLDLRRPSMYKRLAVRHQVVMLIREFFDRHGFLEIETPIFTKSTPEGARDYLVPYRLEPGLFYALPQSPQQYKQLLMVAGFERYFQIARCFRDEAQRADRGPEFTQLDLEMSFVEQEDILALTEAMTIEVVEQVSDKELDKPFPRFTFDESMRRYGTDKPDIRFGLELCDLTAIVSTTDFTLFREAAAAGGSIQAVRYPGAGSLSRKQVDELGTFCKEFGASGLATIAVDQASGGFRSSLGKYLPDEVMRTIAETAEALEGDLICIVADKRAATVSNVLGRLRVEIGSRLGLRDRNRLAFCWVTDFPLVTWDEDEQRWDATHHPFTMPNEGDLELFDTDPGRIRAQCYDIVCNGTEWASGSIRIHRADIQERVFDLLGISREQQQSRFGHILEAFTFGAPPHGGIAPGIDRLLMFLFDEPNIREVIAFPKMGLGMDPMMGAPSEVDAAQLEELGLRIVPRPGTA